MKARVPIPFIAKVQPPILILCLIYSHRFEDNTKKLKERGRKMQSIGRSKHYH